MSVLNNISSPSDLKKLDIESLRKLSTELRAFIVDIVSKEGGHLSASLGVIELTIALHYLFNTPEDKLVWDVGHQAYGHKILTGRKNSFQTNRKKGGISGFPKRAESIFDSFGTGHSSTAISAILGMAIASKLSNNLEQEHIAVVGDGALTGGMAFEALNQAAVSQANILIIINDNSISIDENGGALKEHLFQLKSGEIDAQSNLFELLGFHYEGPVDGNNLDALIGKLELLKEIKGPRILHCVTVKGKGYAPAEDGNAVQWHAPGIFDASTGKVLKPNNTENSPIKFQDIFGKTLLNLADHNQKIVGITPAMASGSSMKFMMDKYPERTFDVDIAEQHAVTFSAGLSTEGFIPFCSIYSTFLQRGYDQLIHDVALQNIKVVFCIDRAGLVGEDGSTHHGAFDIAFLRCIPNLVIAAPMNAQTLIDLMHFSVEDKLSGPIAIRYPRGYSDATTLPHEINAIEIGKGKTIKQGSSVAILSVGNVGLTVQKAFQQLAQEEKEVFGHYDMLFIKPLDESLLHEICQQYKHIITIEDGCIDGGFGSAVLEFMSNNNYHIPLKRLGISDEFVSQGSIQELQQQCGYDENALVSMMKSLL